MAARFGIGFMVLLPILRHHGGFMRPDLAHIMQDIRLLAIIAFPAMLTQLATPISSAYVTRTMAEYGEDAVAAVAIIGRVTPVAFGVIFALSGPLGRLLSKILGQSNMAALRGRTAKVLFSRLLLWC